MSDYHFVVAGCEPDHAASLEDLALRESPLRLHNPLPKRHAAQVELHIARCTREKKFVILGWVGLAIA